MAIIEVNHITKEYQLGQLKSLKDTLLGGVARLRGKKHPAPEKFKALDDINFHIEKGEVVGIIGRNGAGKSTLLKILSQITTPTSGNIKVNGKIAPLIEVGAGLIADLTGRENIILNSTILGISKKEIHEKMDGIIEFSELQDFIDTPVKRYSSGMKIKLGFSIATSLDSEILIVDEVLAVGDLAFQRKCFDRMEELIKKQQKTVLIVSHNIRQVERLSDRVMLLDNGKIIADGNPKKVCNLFYGRSDEIIKSNIKQLSSKYSEKQHRTTGEVELLDFSIRDEHANSTDKISYFSTANISIHFKANTKLKKPIFALGIHTTDFIYLTTNQSSEKDIPIEIEPGIHEIKCKLADFPLLPGVYSFRISISAGEITSTIFYAENLLSFQVVSKNIERSMTTSEGFINMDVDWLLNSKTKLYSAKE